MGKKVLVLGSGSREQAIAWKLSLSEKVSSVLVAPGNAGSEYLGPKVSNLDLDPSQVEKVVQWSVSNEVDLVVVGPEDPLNRGVVDQLTLAKIKCFGPTRAAAKIETDKEFSKNFMKKHSIPTAKYEVFCESKKAQEFIKSAPFNATVIKATGLTGGKGVIVATDRNEAVQIVPRFLEESLFGSSGERIVVEEHLDGQEVSLLVVTDGINVVIMPPVQDHKRAYDGDQGPNTGGMGAVGPVPFVDEKLLGVIRRTIVLPTINGLRNDGLPFKGCLFVGLMLTKEGPKVLEFNARFGDPETQSVLPLLDTDLFDIFMACCNGQLDKIQVEWKKDMFTCGIVIASENYPSKPVIGRQIFGLEQIANTDLLVFHGGTKKEDGRVVTSSGRILTVTAMAANLSTAISKAKSGVKLIKIPGSFYRKDIGVNALTTRISTEQCGHNLTYKAAGVDIVAGERLVDRIKSLVKSINCGRRGTLDSIGSFGALFDLKSAGYMDPILVSGTDGVGTKLKVAIEYEKYDTIGIDLVAMCVNDIIVQGAEPLFFLDYYATSQLNVDVAAQVIKGIVTGCKESNCSLIGGETAEMPGMYHPGDFDLAGFCVGAADRHQLLPRMGSMKDGDILIGLPSSGIHSNGYSLVRKLLEVSGFKLNDIAPFTGTGEVTIADVLLEPTKLYVKSLVPAIKTGMIKGMAHITGGGLLENIPRVLPSHLTAHLNCNNWKIPTVFRWIQNCGNVTDEDMLRTFNCGLGMVVITSKSDAEATLGLLRSCGESDASVVGRLIKSVSKERVIVENFSEQIVVCKDWLQKRRVAVLISGDGSNLQALIDHTMDPMKQSHAEIALVLSNVHGVRGLERAAKAGVKAVVVPSKGKKREEFDREVNQVLLEHKIEFVCLAGFMRIVSPFFVKEWEGKLINIHPSLLPSFPGMQTHEQVLQAGVKIHGSTIHFVDSGVDTGAIIAQEAVPVMNNDTPQSLQERVKIEIEHKLYPTVMELLVREKVSLDLKSKKCVWK